MTIRDIAVDVGSAAHFVTFEWHGGVQLWSLADRALVAELEVQLDDSGPRPRCAPPRVSPSC